jgi:hypothetical protein
MWAFPVLSCALLASALLLRRRPLTALAVMLGGWVAAMALKPVMPASVLEIVIAGAAGVEICYIAATRTRRVSVTGLAMVGVALLIPGRAVSIWARSGAAQPWSRSLPGLSGIRSGRPRPGPSWCARRRPRRP